MPQMAPISWLLLFFIFLVTLILFSITNYYSFLPPSAKLSQKEIKTFNSLNWKW